MPDMLDIYRRHRAEYDRLVAAEDHLLHLPALLRQLLDWRGRRVIEAGTGTGRVTALYAADADAIVCLEREPHMLDAARQRLAAYAGKISFLVADNLDLPRLPAPGDLFIEGWSWGHSIVDEPASVATTTARLFENARRTLVDNAPVLIVETMGTNQDTPAPPHPRLAEFYNLLQSRYRLRPHLVRTDYRFDSVPDAADTLGFFFGDDMRRSVLARNSPVIPEWTGVWHGSPAVPPL